MTNTPFKTTYRASEERELEIHFQVCPAEPDVGLMTDWPEWWAYDEQGQLVDDEDLSEDDKMDIVDKCMDVYRGKKEDAQRTQHMAATVPSHVLPTEAL